MLALQHLRWPHPKRMLLHVLAIVLTASSTSLLAFTSGERSEAAQLYSSSSFSSRTEASGSTLSLGAFDMRRMAREALASQREALLNRSVTVNFASSTNDPHTHGSWTVSVGDHLDWVYLGKSMGVSRFVLDHDRMLTYLRASLLRELPPAQSGLLGNRATDPYGITRVTIDGQPREGYSYDADAAAMAIVNALDDSKQSVTISLAYQPATVGDGEHLLARIAAGRSDFTGSVYGRAANVKKALGHLNGVVVPAGQKFSFNPVMENQSGWLDALGIFDGQDLLPVKGGGICQVSTTLYRSILHAGVPVVSRANHSLYISYYKAHGVGLDATVFFGSQDLQFINDTGSDIIIRSWYEGTQAFVEFYGIPDGRTVQMAGPYFAGHAPEEFSINGRPLYANEIGWKQIVTHADGSQTTNAILSRYKAIPRALAAEYTTDMGHDL